MKVCGIIAEYHPFHSGHRYHIDMTYEKGATHIAVVMSTSFVQRGEPAMFDLFTRAKAALQQGADLVAALPTPYCMAGAGVFCRAGVESLSLLGCDSISFGCETSADALFALKEACASALQSEVFLQSMAKGMHFARARAEAVQALCGAANALNDANTALALGYLEANDRLPFPMQPTVIARAGVSHDAASPENGFASASYLRKHPKEWDPYLPDAPLFTNALQNGQTVDPILAQRILLALLKTKTPADWAMTAGVSEGLENKLYEAAQRAMSVGQLLDECKSKRYPLSSLRRMLWSAALGITDALQKKEVPGLWILGANQKGYEILSRARALRKERGISAIITPKFADFAAAYPVLGTIEHNAADIRALCTPAGEQTDLYRTRLSPLDK